MGSKSMKQTHQHSWKWRMKEKLVCSSSRQYQILKKKNLIIHISHPANKLHPQLINNLILPHPYCLSMSPFCLFCTKYLMNGHKHIEFFIIFVFSLNGQWYILMQSHKNQIKNGSTKMSLFLLLVPSESKKPIRHCSSFFTSRCRRQQSDFSFGGYVLAYSPPLKLDNFPGDMS